MNAPRHKDCYTCDSISVLLIVVFSACGGIPTGITIVCQFDSRLSRAGLGILGKGGLFVAPPLENCLTGLTGSSTRAGTGCTHLQLIGNSVTDCQALTWWGLRYCIRNVYTRIRIIFFSILLLSHLLAPTTIFISCIWTKIEMNTTVKHMCMHAGLSQPSGSRLCF